jgi:GNAT superfamily N-acetyltransferase
MLKIYPVKTDKDIETAKMLFAEFDSFLKKQLVEYQKFPWAIKYWQNLGEEVNGLPGKYAKPHGCILIANYKNKPSGCVGLLRESSEVSIMKRLYVREGFRGLGIGKSLVKTIIKHAHNKGYKIMRLHTNLLLNTAINLYKSLGFEEVSHNREYPKEIKDLIVHMELKLA